MCLREWERDESQAGEGSSGLRALGCRWPAGLSAGGATGRVRLTSSAEGAGSWAHSHPYRAAGSAGCDLGSRRDENLGRLPGGVGRRREEGAFLLSPPLGGAACEAGLPSGSGQARRTERVRRLKRESDSSGRRGKPPPSPPPPTPKERFRRPWAGWRREGLLGAPGKAARRTRRAKRALLWRLPPRCFLKSPPSPRVGIGRAEVCERKGWRT